jgi:hypothetical protein
MPASTRSSDSAAHTSACTPTRTTGPGRPCRRWHRRREHKLAILRSPCPRGLSLETHLSSHPNYSHPFLDPAEMMVGVITIIAIIATVKSVVGRHDNGLTRHEIYFRQLRWDSARGAPAFRASGRDLDAGQATGRRRSATATFSVNTAVPHNFTTSAVRGSVVGWCRPGRRVVLCHRLGACRRAVHRRRHPPGTPGAAEWRGRVGGVE